MRVTGERYAIKKQSKRRVFREVGHALSGDHVSGSYDPRLTAYFGDAVLQAGFMPVPHLFLRHYRELGLSHIQAMFVLQLMEIAWDVSSPPTSVSKLAARMGVGHRTIQVCSKELHELGLVEIYDQFDQEGAQVENGYDLSPLLRRLAEFAPAARPAGEPRERRARVRPADEDGAPTLLPPAETCTPPVQIPAPAPRRDLHPPPADPCTPPVITDSGAYMEVKNLRKNQPRKQQQQQRAAAAAAAQLGWIEQEDQSPLEAGRSLRWDVPLSPAELRQTRQVLARIGLNADVADAVAPGLHPAECWALWLHARSSRLRPAWISTQLYDGRGKQPRMAGIPSQCETVGRLLAELPPALAELVIDITDRCCPDDVDVRWSAVQTDPRYSPDGPDLAAALEAAWAAMLLERAPSVADTRPAHRPPEQPGLLQPAADDPRWLAARGELAAQLPRDAFTAWIAPVELVEVDGDVIVLATPNLFVRGELTGTYATALAAALRHGFGREMQVEVVIDMACAV